MFELFLESPESWELNRPCKAWRLPLETYNGLRALRDDLQFSCRMTKESSSKNCFPIKTLMSEEISRRTSTNQNLPSVVARLMGVEMLPFDSDQPFGCLDGDEGISKSFIDKLEVQVNRYVASTEAAIEDQMNSRRQFEDHMENIRESILHWRQEHEVKLKTQAVVHPIWFDEDDSDNQHWETNLHDITSILDELLYDLSQQTLGDDEISDAIDMNSSIGLSHSHPQDLSPPPTPMSKDFVHRELSPIFLSHAAYYLLSIVEETSLNCLHQAKLEGIWNQDPYVVSFDTYYGRQPLFD